MRCKTHAKTSAGEDKGHYHSNCHCRIVAGKKDTCVEGYKPEEILKALGDKVTIVGLTPGKPMSFEEADHLRANPKYKYIYEAWVKFTKGEITEETFKRIQNNYAGYSVNCQTCVVANEARRRGYNVRALPNNKKPDSPTYLLSRDTSLAYIDRETGKQPKYITYTGKGIQDYRGKAIPTKNRFVTWLNSDGVVEENARYTIEMCWKSGGGHIICLDRTNEGLRLFDPQINRRYTGENISNYFDSVKFFTTYKGNKISVAPKLLRVDNVDFNKKLVDKILEKA